MTFTESARRARRAMAQDQREKILQAKGWAEPLVPPKLLEELGIKFEIVGDPRGAKWRRGGQGVYAPVWVYAIVDRSGAKTTRSVRPLLLAARDDLLEQRCLCTEISMDNGLPSRVRRAASNYVKVTSRKANPHGQPQRQNRQVRL